MKEFKLLSGHKTVPEFIRKREKSEKIQIVEAIKTQDLHQVSPKCS